MSGRARDPSVLERRSILERTSAKTLLGNLVRKPGYDDSSTPPEAFLLPDYVYGTLQGLENRTMTLAAPTRAGRATVTVSFTEHTAVRRIEGDSVPLTDVKTGSRIEAVGFLIGDDLSARLAHKVWINSYCSHGDIIGSDPKAGTVTLQQAHGGNVRKLHITDSALLYGAHDPLEVADLWTRVNTGQHIFFTGFTHTESKACEDITVIRVDGPW